MLIYFSLAVVDYGIFILLNTILSEGDKYYGENYFSLI